MSTIPTIDFSHNWNNKLMCVCFTTIRLRNDAKYQVGNIYPVTYHKTEQLGTATVVDIKHFKLAQLTEFMARIDTGYSAEKTREIIVQMYKRHNFNWAVQELSFILLEQPATAIRYIVPSKVKKVQKDADLFNPSETIFTH